MHLKITLILLLNLLIINESFARDAALESCDSALLKRQFSQAINIAEKHPAQAEFWLCKGRAQSALNQSADAEQSFKKAIALNPQGLGLISAYMLLGNVQQESRHIPAALDSYQQALKLSEQQNMRRYVRIAHNLIGEALFENGQYSESLQAFQAGEKLALNDDERADSYVHEALTFQQMQQLDQAIEYQLKGVMMLRKSAEPQQYAEASLVLAKLFVAKKDFVSADKTYQRLMEYAQENGGSFYEAKTAIEWAAAKHLQNDAAGAERLLAQAESISQKIQDPELTAMLEKARAANP
jgi:tetratricopeptide (TPR) repeat protein